MEQEKGYKSIGTNYQQEYLGSMLSAHLMFYDHTGKAEWEFSIFDLSCKTHTYKGNLQETVELILLGKLYKEQLEKEAKDTQVEESLAKVEGV